MEWRREILAGVTSVPLMGTPGRIIVFGEQAEAILTGTNEEDVVVAAAQYGRGRVVVFSEGGYFFNRMQPGADVLFSNVTRWITKGSQSEAMIEGTNEVAIAGGSHTNAGGEIGFIDLQDTAKREDELLAARLLVWCAKPDTVAIGSDRLLEYIKEGGALIHVVTPWAWSGYKRPLHQMPLWNVLVTVGLCYTEVYLESPSQIIIQDNKAERSNLLKFLRENATNPTDLLRKPGLLNSLNLLPKDILHKDEIKSVLDMIYQAILSQVREIVPTSKSPTTSQEQVALLNLWKMIVDVQELTGIKAPSRNNFPGDFESSPALQTVTCEYTADREDIHPTGVYCPAGQIFEVDVISGNTAGTWSLLVGAHTDVLKGENLRRWPVIHMRKLLTSTSYRLSSPFGGLAYLQSPDQVGSSIKVKFTNVAEAPQFIAGNQNLNNPAVEAWTTRRSAPGLWADIIGRHIILTLPSTSVRDINDPGDATRLWDRVVRICHQLRGTDVTRHRRQWIVADEQLSVVRYMHSGYPIVTHLDVAQPETPNFLLNGTNLRANGSWGPFHEIGHNMQRPEWTFDGTGEVTTNIFTLHVTDVLCGHRPWPHMQDHLSAAIEYLKDGAEFSKWKDNPFIALFIYAQLARDFGWDAYRTVFRCYEEMTKDQKPISSQNKIDEWFRQFSDATGRNLAPMVRFWGIPLTAEATQAMEKFPAFFPEDETTRGAEDRTSKIVLEFPGVTRIP